MSLSKGSWSKGEAHFANQGTECWSNMTQEKDGEKYPWAGPALFAAVAVALLVFFWWFLSAG